MGLTFYVAFLALVASVASAVFYVLQHNKYTKDTFSKDEKWALKNPGAIANIVSMVLTLLLTLMTMMEGGGGGDSGD